jgi:hypothetical protein
MSRPNMALPTSARLAEDFFLSAIAVVLLILFFGYGGLTWITKKPTAVASRGFLSKFILTTSTDGVAYYDGDGQFNLSKRC